MKTYIFFSVYEHLFHRVSQGLKERGVDQFCGFVWSPHQLEAMADGKVTYDPVIVFTRDLLPLIDDGTPPDIAWLEKRERELGVSIQRMLSAERHLLEGRDQDQLLRLAEVVLRAVGDALDREKPDFIYSEDVSCFCSYAHFVLARERNIPFWSIGAGRLPNRLIVYSAGLQRSEVVEGKYDELRARGLTATERAEAVAYVDGFKNRPERPPGMADRAAAPGVGKTEVKGFGVALKRWLADRKDPTSMAPHLVIRQRLRRIARIRAADALGVFERPVDGEKYVIYPIHFQPEATTLVQAPMYLDQAQLIQDIARSLPIGHRLYVKEHLSNRGRRPVSFYRTLRAIPNVRLLGPDEDTWTLIRGASAIAVITGTMGWEGLLFGKPVITFGNSFMNVLPQTYVGSEQPKDRWYEMFRRALFAHVDAPDALLALVSALQQTSSPGRIHNPNAFPIVLEEENVQLILQALAAAVLPDPHRPR